MHKGGISLHSVPYTLTRKPVKNINLRVRRDGSVASGYQQNAV
jgi:hypothetical protein